MQAPKKKTLLVLDGNSMHDWPSLFSGKTTIDGSPIRVVQASWNDTTIVVYPDIGPLVTMAPVRDSDNEAIRPRTVNIKPGIFRLLQ